MMDALHLRCHVCVYGSVECAFLPWVALQVLSVIDLFHPATHCTAVQRIHCLVEYLYALRSPTVFDVTSLACFVVAVSVLARPVHVRMWMLLVSG